MTREPAPPAALLGNRDLAASLAVAVSGAAWGNLWIPIRAIEAGGISGGWGAMAMFGTALVLLLPFVPARIAHLRAGGFAMLATGLFTGAGFGLYTTSLVLTDVVRVLLLFYLTPVWGTVLGRILLGEPITRPRLAALVLGLAGLAVILDDGNGLPAPRNAGDWMALAAGLAWAYGTLRVYDQELRADAAAPGPGLFESVFAFLVGGALVSVPVLLLPLAGNVAPPPPEVLWQVLPWLLGVSLVLVLPTLFLTLWGASLLDPGRVGLLLMLEVVVGISSASVLTDEPFGAREIFGTLLILGAAALEVLRGTAEPLREANA